VRRLAKRLLPWVGALWPFAAVASSAACLWLAFAAWQVVGGPTTPVLLGLGLALVGPVGWIAAMAAFARRERTAMAEAQRHNLGRRQATLKVLDLLPVAVALCDLQRDRVGVNRAMARLLGTEGEGLGDLALDWKAMIAADDWSAWLQTCSLARQSGQAQWLRCGLRTASGVQPVVAQIVPVDGESGPELAVSLTPRQSEAGLAQEAVLQLRDLLGLAEAQKWEFGQAVHDELGQRLSGIAYFAKSLQRKLEQAQRAEAEDARWLQDLANESISIARGLARGLVPVGTDDPGALVAALAEVCENVRRSFNVRCDLHVDPGFDPGGATRANHLYHAVQELVTNACKHGDAFHVQVTLEVDDEGQQVTVLNDGHGLAPAPERAGMGLNGVRSRIAYLGGRFTLADEPGGGVRATIGLPLPAAPSRGAEQAGPSATS
jgi:signal transduction histidine kinase